MLALKIFATDCKFNNYLSSYDTTQNKVSIPWNENNLPSFFWHVLSAVEGTLSVQQCIHWRLPAPVFEHNNLCHKYHFSYASIKWNLITPASMQLWKMINNPGFIDWVTMNTKICIKGLCVLLAKKGFVPACQVLHREAHGLRAKHLMRQLCPHRVFAFDLIQWEVGMHFVL